MYTNWTITGTYTPNTNHTHIYLPIAKQLFEKEWEEVILTHSHLFHISTFVTSCSQNYFVVIVSKQTQRLKAQTLHVKTTKTFVSEFNVF